jgi:thiamine biosynthesis protein ThiS
MCSLRQLGFILGIPIIVGMKILLNGQDFELAAGTSIAGLVRMRQESGHLRTTAYAVERNKEVVVRPHHEATHLESGDHVEIVVMVGGG